jgi:thiol reductant ABC exporter CydD subunit
VVLGALAALLVVAQAWLLARIIGGAASEGADLAALAPVLALLLAVVVGRAALAWSAEVTAHRASATVKSQLRTALAARATVLGPDGLAARGTGDLTVLATQGIDALDGYFARYLPQLVLAVVVPLTVLVAVAAQDWISAAVIAVTVPLIPLFMALIGLAARRSTHRQLGALQHLAGRFLDLVAGLTTLKLFGRSKAQVRTIRSVAEAYRRTTMGTLRLAFLSSLVLELVASVAVALVAVSVGLRLLHGHLELGTAMFLLVLAPEAYLPLRHVGASFHASAPGLSAADQVLSFLDATVPARPASVPPPDLAAATITVSGLVVRYPGRSDPALDGASLTIAPRELVALTGPSGAGKSTLLSVLLGFVAPAAGGVRVGGVDLDRVDLDAWRDRIAWVPQRPHLFATTIRENVRLGREAATEQEVLAAVDAAGLAPVVARLPHGLDTLLGERGAGLSAGERQRVAIARALLRDAPLVLLDEPTAGLDGATEAEVLASLRRLVAGRTVLLVAHRPQLVAMADRVVHLGGRP